MTTPNLPALPTVVSYTQSRTGAGVLNLTGGGSVWLPLPEGVSTIQVTGYGDATVTVLVSSATAFGNVVARRELKTSPNGASTVLNGIGRNRRENRYLYMNSTATVEVSVVITTIPLG